MKLTSNCIEFRIPASIANHSTGLLVDHEDQRRREADVKKNNDIGELRNYKDDDKKYNVFKFNIIFHELASLDSMRELELYKNLTNLFENELASDENDDNNLNDSAENETYETYELNEQSEISSKEYDDNYINETTSFDKINVEEEEDDADVDNNFEMD